MKTQISQTQAYDFWTLLNKQSSWQLGRTLPSSVGTGIPAGSAQRRLCRRQLWLRQL